MGRICTLAGRGRFWRGVVDLGEVSYDLRVDQEWLHVTTNSGVEKLEGMKAAAGTFRAECEEVAVRDEDIVELELADQRRIEVRIVSSFWGREGGFVLTPRGGEVLLGA